MLDSLFFTGIKSSTTIFNLLIALAVALVLGFINSLIYLKIRWKGTPSQSFSVTLVVLPAIVTVIILMVGNNVAGAFGLAGAFSIIRFRTNGGPKDITYVLFSMAIGLACGMGFVLYAAISALVLCGTMIVLEYSGFGHPKMLSKQLRITIPENLDYNSAFEDVFDKYTLDQYLSRIKTVELGSLYQLVYEITIKTSVNEKEFMDELRSRNGNLDILLILSTDSEVDKL